MRKMKADSLADLVTMAARLAAVPASTRNAERRRTVSVAGGSTLARDGERFYVAGRLA
jgi:hypothetical protein